MIAPVPDPRWPEDVQALYRHDVREMWDPTIAKHVWNQYHNQISIYLSLVGKNDPLDILDVGCAQGTLALLLAESGHTVCALDMRQQFLDYASSRYETGNVEFVCANILEAELGKQFDLIFANQIIEHLVCPVEFADRLRGWLKPNGRLILSTPNGGYVRNSLPGFSDLGDLGQYQDRQFSADGDGHFFAYRERELVAIMKKAGFHRLEIRYFETPFISGHMRVRHLHPFVPSRILRVLEGMASRVPGLRKALSHQLLVVGSAYGSPPT